LRSSHTVGASKLPERMKSSSNQDKDNDRLTTINTPLVFASISSRMSGPNQRESSMSAGGFIDKTLDTLLGKYDGKSNSIKALNREKLLRWSKFKVSREYAEVVEDVIEVYENDDTSLYDVLNVRMSVGDDTIRKAYRKLVIALHPGKILIKYFIYIISLSHI
jgi:hypothetical protein